MTDLQELMALAETEQFAAVELFEFAALARRFLRSPAFAEMARDAERWRNANIKRDIEGGQRIECHVIVGVNVYHGERWVGFHQCTPEEHAEVLASFDAAASGGA